VKVTNTHAQLLFFTVNPSGAVQIQEETPHILVFKYITFKEV